MATFTGKALRLTACGPACEHVMEGALTCQCVVRFHPYCTAKSPDKVAGASISSSAVDGST
eukprot:scaffold325974_cov42-Prasinocladus_malaysianus.AAC.1